MEDKGENFCPTTAYIKEWLKNHACTPRDWIMPRRAEFEEGVDEKFDV